MSIGCLLRVWLDYLGYMNVVLVVPLGISNLHKNYNKAQNKSSQLKLSAMKVLKSNDLRAFFVVGKDLSIE